MLRWYRVFPIISAVCFASFPSGNFLPLDGHGVDLTNYITKVGTNITIPTPFSTVRSKHHWAVLSMEQELLSSDKPYVDYSEKFRKVFNLATNNRRLDIKDIQLSYADVFRVFVEPKIGDHLSKDIQALDAMIYLMTYDEHTCGFTSVPEFPQKGDNFFMECSAVVNGLWNPTFVFYNEVDQSEVISEATKCGSQPDVGMRICGIASVKIYETSPLAYTCRLIFVDKDRKHPDIATFQNSKWTNRFNSNVTCFLQKIYLYMSPSNVHLLCGGLPCGPVARVNDTVTCMAYGYPEPVFDISINSHFCDYYKDKAQKLKVMLDTVGLYSSFIEELSNINPLVKFSVLESLSHVIVTINENLLDSESDEHMSGKETDGTKHYLRRPKNIPEALPFVADHLMELNKLLGIQVDWASYFFDFIGALNFTNVDAFGETVNKLIVHLINANKTLEAKLDHYILLEERYTLMMWGKFVGALMDGLFKLKDLLSMGDTILPDLERSCSQNMVDLEIWSHLFRKDVEVCKPFDKVKQEYEMLQSLFRGLCYSFKANATDNFTSIFLDANEGEAGAENEEETGAENEAEAGGEKEAEAGAENEAGAGAENEAEAGAEKAALDVVASAEESDINEASSEIIPILSLEPSAYSSMGDLDISSSPTTEEDEMQSTSDAENEPSKENDLPSTMDIFSSSEEPDYERSEGASETSDSIYFSSYSDYDLDSSSSSPEDGISSDYDNTIEYISDMQTDETEDDTMYPSQMSWMSLATINDITSSPPESETEDVEEEELMPSMSYTLSDRDIGHVEVLCNVSNEFGWESSSVAFEVLPLESDVKQDHSAQIVFLCNWKACVNGQSVAPGDYISCVQKNMPNGWWQMIVGDDTIENNVYVVAPSTDHWLRVECIISNETYKDSMTMEFTLFNRSLSASGEGRAAAGSFEISDSDKKKGDKKKDERPPRPPQRQPPKKKKPEKLAPAHLSEVEKSKAERRQQFALIQLFLVLFGIHLTHSEL